MKKSELRQQYLTLRAALSEAEYQKRNQQVVAQFSQKYPFEQFRIVHCFLPAERQREVDTWPIIHRLWTMPSVRVVAPRCSLQDGTLTHHELKPDTVLETNRWGIPEPVAESPAYLPQHIDLVLVPLLTFDQRGHRVGYGKGFYDRFLQECRADTLKVGLSLFAPVDKIDDIFEGDVALDKVIRPNQR